MAMSDTEILSGNVGNIPRFDFYEIPTDALGTKKYELACSIARNIYFEDTPSHGFLEKMITKYLTDENSTTVMIDVGGKLIASSVRKIYPNAGMLELVYAVVEEQYRNAFYRFGQLMLEHNLSVGESMGMELVFGKSMGSDGFESLIDGGLETPLSGKVSIDHEYVKDKLKQLPQFKHLNIGDDLTFSVDDEPFYKSSPFQPQETSNPTVRKIISNLGPGRIGFASMQLDSSRRMIKYNHDMISPILDFSLLEPLQGPSLQISNL
jgi:hypothetical protein